jgi:thiamine pyrophosphate-dependent acetolactate synthase large subunit-like protein
MQFKAFVGLRCRLTQPTKNIYILKGNLSQINAAIQLIRESRRLLLYVGGGAIAAKRVFEKSKFILSGRLERCPPSH